MSDRVTITRRLLGAVALSLPCSSSLAAEVDMALPTLEFLEYLGEWQDESGELIDPLLLDAEDRLDDLAHSEGESK